jgi:hypothetical protein
MRPGRRAASLQHNCDEHSPPHIECQPYPFGPICFPDARQIRGNVGEERHTATGLRRALNIRRHGDRSQFCPARTQAPLGSIVRQAMCRKFRGRKFEGARAQTPPWKTRLFERNWAKLPDLRRLQALQDTQLWYPHALALRFEYAAHAPGLCPASGEISPAWLSSSVADQQTPRNR